MAETTFYLYPASNDGDFNFMNPSLYSGIDDPHDAVTPSDYCALGAHSDGSTSRNCRGSWGLTAPPTGVTTINWIRLHLAGGWKTSSGGSWTSEPICIALLRPGGSSTYYASSTRTIVAGYSTSGSYQVTDVPASSPYGHAYWHFATNPATASAWTVADLQALLVSYVADTSITTSPASIGMAQCPPGELGSNFLVRAGGIYVEVNAVAADESIEGRRSMGSAYLRFLRNPAAIFDMKVPLLAGAADVGDVVPVTHELGPTEDGTGWGREQWSRRYAQILDKQLDPTGRTWLIRAMDLRAVHTRLWFPGITDLAFTDEGQGIPYLDSGGGRTMGRINAAVESTYGYTPVQAEGTLYTQVAQGTERWSPDGVAIFRALDAEVKNNSFSQGSGATFTDWTPVTVGSGTVGEGTAIYLFDVSGYRRYAVLNSSVTAESAARLRAVTGSLAAGYLRLHVKLMAMYLGSGDGLVYRLQRNSDNYYWTESSDTWGSAAVYNPLTVTADTVTDHQAIATTTGTTTYNLDILADNRSTTTGATGRFQARFYYANLWHSTAADDLAAKRPPFITTSAAQEEGGDLLYFENPASARCWDVTRGSAKLSVKAAFAHGDLTATTPRYLLTNYVDSSNYERLYFEKVDASTCRVRFERVTGSTSRGTVTATLTGDDRPSVDSVMKVGLRWQATDGELGESDYAVKLYVSTDGRTPITGTGTMSAAGDASVAKLYFGATAAGSQIDGYLRDLDVSPYVLTDAEVYRRLGV